MPRRTRLASLSELPTYVSVYLPKATQTNAIPIDAPVPGLAQNKMTPPIPPKPDGLKLQGLNEVRFVLPMLSFRLSSRKCRL